MPELLIVENLKKYFPVKGLFGKTVGWVRAVDDVSFSILEGETVSYTHLTLPTTERV